jgi:co-chaperonin GroES (HSP10)
MKSKLNKLVAIFVIGALAGWLLAARFYEKRSNETQIVTKDRIVTKIVERKDGSKETVIVEDRTKKENTRTAKISQWSAGVSKTLSSPEVWAIQVDRRIIGNLFFGGFVTTNKVYAALIRYEF